MRRRRAIEDLSANLRASLREVAEEARAQRRSVEDHLESHPSRPVIERTLAELCDLVARHNRYYPIEANLAAAPRTGELLERNGAPWRPLAVPSLAEFLTASSADTLLPAARNR
jgi:hypothetical protein